MLEHAVAVQHHVEAPLGAPRLPQQLPHRRPGPVQGRGPDAFVVGKIAGDVALQLGEQGRDVGQDHRGGAHQAGQHAGGAEAAAELEERGRGVGAKTRAVGVVEVFRREDGRGPQPRPGPFGAAEKGSEPVGLQLRRQRQLAPSRAHLPPVPLLLRLRPGVAVPVRLRRGDVLPPSHLPGDQDLFLHVAVSVDRPDRHVVVLVQIRVLLLGRGGGGGVGGVGARFQNLHPSFFVVFRAARHGCFDY
mmetsp:Transcript_6446/g.13923  ORF Transcript_6446/g.13923 Transcript_6446/m.13923 type:complete len:246 (-) Transcript_6446:86-823(-)